MIFFYKLLDYTLISTIHIPFLYEETNDNVERFKVIYLKVYYENYDNKSNGESVVIDFNYNLTYIIYQNDNLIEVYTDSDEKVISSFFNVPLSIYMMRDNAVILHTSSIEIEGKIFAFCGEKGAGKSTLTFLLSQTYNFFSDDTLLLKKEKGGLYARNIISIMRLCKDTYEKITQLNNFDNYQHNVVGKAYVSPENVNFKTSCVNFGQLKAIFFIKRISEPIFKLHKIDSSIVKYINIVNNIVGSHYIRNEWLLEEHTKELLKPIVDNVTMYKLYLPSNFEFIKENFTQFLKEVLEKMR